MSVDLSDETTLLKVEPRGRRDLTGEAVSTIRSGQYRRRVGERGDSAPGGTLVEPTVPSPPSLLDILSRSALLFLRSFLSACSSASFVGLVGTSLTSPASK
jgi:hypothetical protein